MEIKELFKSAVQRLKKAGIPEPDLEVSLLLAHLLKIDRTSLLLSLDRDLDDVVLGKFENNISRRLQREPLAYISGEKEFWSLPFKVTRDVLIPRPETEFLIELTLKTVKNQFEVPEDQVLNILDLGTGSGIISIVLASELSKAEITAVDISLKALKVAIHNAKRHKVGERIQFVNSDWFGGISTRAKYDLVVANPPYIARDILEKPFGETSDSLQPEVGRYEPYLALDGGEQGIQSISRIAEDLEKILKPGGWFFMEIGADQAEVVTAIFDDCASYEEIAVHKDYAGLPRVFQARKQ